MYDHFRTEVCLRYSRKYVIEDTWYTPAADNMKKVCTNIPKWKYLSGISKEQRLKDLAEEQALREQNTPDQLEKEQSNESLHPDFKEEEGLENKLEQQDEFLENTTNELLV